MEYYLYLLRRLFTVRNILIILVVLTAMLFAGWAGYKQYRKWSCSRLTARGKEYLEKGDIRNAVLCLRKAAQANPRKLEAFKLMAEITENARFPQAIGWYKQIVLQEPTLEHRLSLARCAMRFGDHETAKTTLNEVPANQRENAAYYKSVGVLSLAYKQPAMAVACFEKAQKFTPEDASIRFDLASIQLHATDTNVVQLARKNLELCKTNAALRLETLRLLVWDCGRQGSFREAAQYADALLKEPKSSFSDKLLRLDILNKSSNALLNPSITALKAEIGTNIQKAFQLGEWLKNNQRAADALAWISALPAGSQTNMPLPLLLAECRATLNDYKTLLKQVENEQWGTLDYLRHAVSAKASKEIGNQSQFQASWQKSIALAQNQLEPLSQLIRFAAKETWTNEHREVLWSMAANYPTEKWVFQTLEAHLYAQGDTPQLQKLYRQMVDVDPKDYRSKNNLAFTSLLLDPRSTTAYALARESYNSNPTNAYFISTLAFALHVRNQTNEAVKLCERLDAKQLENPAIAVCYGIVLGSAGNASAIPFLDMAEKHRMLPEILALARRVKLGIVNN